MAALYSINDHPEFSEPLSKEDLWLLSERGVIARGEFCTDLDNGQTHTIGELIRGMRPPSPLAAESRVERPAFQEIRADHDGIDDDDEWEDEEEGDDEGFVFTSSGERIMHHAHPSWLSYTKALVLAALLCIAAGLGFQFGTRYFLLGMACASATVTCIAIARFSKDYLITEDRVEVLWGIIGRSSKEVRIRDIRSIDVSERWITGLLGIGSLDFSSAANAGVEVAFKNVRSAHKIKELVRQLQKLQDGDDD